MVTRSLVFILACSSYLLIIEMFVVKTIAIRITPNGEEFLIKNQRTRTRTRQNYVVQRALAELDKEMPTNLDDFTVPDTYDSETNPEELSAQIVDYANMIRNDIIFLDNSVETTTRKKGNINKKNQIFPDNPCTCESKKKVTKLGKDYYPQVIEQLECLQTCGYNYTCKEVYYTMTMMKKRTLEEEIPLPEFHNRWIEHTRNITVSCICTERNN